MKDMYDYATAKQSYQKNQFPNIKVVVTGSGRVGQGAVQVLKDMGIRQVSVTDFLALTFNDAVFTHLSSEDYVTRKDGGTFEKKHFYQNPGAYKSNFLKFAKVADVLIHGIYWDSRAPVLFTRPEMCSADFNIQVIADVTCDIAPQSSIPSTLKASSIAVPVFGYDPVYNTEILPFQEHGIDVMSIDNLPSEMPRDASESFGNQFLTYVLPELLKPQSAVIERATIAKNGKLTPGFEYLEDYVSYSQEA
jgi:alanine dehydrogenase